MKWIAPCVVCVLCVFSTGEVCVCVVLPPGGTCGVCVSSKGVSLRPGLGAPLVRCDRKFERVHQGKKFPGTTLEPAPRLPHAVDPRCTRNEPARGRTKQQDKQTDGHLSCLHHHRAAIQRPLPSLLLLSLLSLSP